MGKGKHFIGDFLPPEELEKFMETFKALKVGFPSVSGWSRNQEFRSVVIETEAWTNVCSLLLQEGRDPDYSEYKEFKLTVENLGFRMLMKMGWKEGEGLGSDSQGIKAPVNKYARLSEGESTLSLIFCHPFYLMSFSCIISLVYLFHIFLISHVCL